MSEVVGNDALISWIYGTFGHPLHFVAEVAMAFFIFYLLNIKSYRDPHHDEKLTLAEEESLIADWKPEPLCGTDADHEQASFPLLEGPPTAHVTIDGTHFINMVSCGVHGLQNHPEVKNVAEETARLYGVGSCGPRGFYGSLKPHNDFETKIAKFMGTQGGVLYGSEFQAIATVLPAFLKEGDIAIIDKGVSFAVQNGINLCRCQKKWFAHNNMDDFKLRLQELQKEFDLQKNRVFFIAEGVYANTGDIIPLNEVMALKEKYPFRMILEESYSVGVLGKSGRGVTEHFGVDITQIEVIVASLGNALGGVGGFSVCEELLASHQRLNCTGYVFSCALPPLSSAASSKVLDLLESTDCLKRLQENLNFAYPKLKAIKDLVLTSHPSSPYIRLVLREVHQDHAEATRKLKAIQQFCHSSNVLVSVFEYQKEQFPGQPCLRLSIFADHTQKDIEIVVNALTGATQKICS